MRLLPVVLFAASCSPPPMMMNDGGSSGCEGPAKSPPNLLADPSFECGTAVWTVVTGDFAVVSGGRTGEKAGRLSATTAGSGQAGLGPVVASTSGKAYCLYAWVSGSASDMRMEVLPTMAGVASSFSSPVPASGWLQAPMSSNLKVQVAAGDSLYLRFRILNSQAGQTLDLDDLDLWESQSGNCDERH